MAAKTADSVPTVCFQDGWINAPHRVLRNRTVEIWESAGCPPPGKRPGEGDLLATNSATGTTRRRYATNGPAPGDSGSLDELALWAGRGAGDVHDIPSAGELAGRLWQECLRSPRS